MELSKFNMSIENEQSMFISRVIIYLTLKKSPRHNLKSFQLQDSKMVTSMDNNNIELITYLKTDSFNEPKSICENEKKLTENGNVKINNMDTSFTDNIHMNMIETISDNVFFKDQSFFSLIKDILIL